MSKQLTWYKKEQLINKLSDRDYFALNSIYNFRCLTYEQIYEIAYKYNEKTGNINDKQYSKRKISTFLKLEIIKEKVLYDKDIENIYTLTSKGINLLKKYNKWADNIYDEHKRIVKKGYLTESELNLKERFIPHQYNLNKFVLKLEELYHTEEFKYEDEKHAESFVGIRPDGILKTENITYFLEMDMGTENVKQLKEKWDHYRKFISSNEFLLKDNKIVVLFIVEGVSKINQRMALIKNTIFENFIDLFEKDIEIYVDTPEFLLELIENKFIHKNSLNNELKQVLKNNNFKVITDQNIIKNIFDIDYYLFARKEKNDVAYDYIFEDFEYSPMSCVYKSIFLDRFTKEFKETSNPDLKFILVCDDEVEAFRAYNLFELKDILFTTRNRLKALEFHEAIFKLDVDGNILCFNDNFSSFEKFGIVKL